MGKSEWNGAKRIQKKGNKLKNIKITARKYPDYAICNCVSVAQREGGCGAISRLTPPPFLPPDIPLHIPFFCTTSTIQLQKQQPEPLNRLVISKSDA